MAYSDPTSQRELAADKKRTREHNRRVSLTTKINADLLTALKRQTDWVKAALNCKAWEWDGDQREAAELELAEALAIIAKAETP